MKATEIKYISSSQFGIHETQYFYHLEKPLNSKYVEVKVVPKDALMNFGKCKNGSKAQNDWLRIIYKANQ